MTLSQADAHALAWYRNVLMLKLPPGIKEGQALVGRRFTEETWTERWAPSDELVCSVCGLAETEAEIHILCPCGSEDFRNPNVGVR